MIGNLMRMLSRRVRRRWTSPSAAGGRRDLEAAKNELLAAYVASSAADWRLERQREQDGYYRQPGAEREIIAYGRAAIPVAEELLASFDHRVRCSGLMILSAIQGREAMAEILVEHLDDPYGPIRWRCWQALRDMKALPPESMPPSHRDHLGPWRRIKQACRMAMEVCGLPAEAPGITVGKAPPERPFPYGKGGGN